MSGQTTERTSSDTSSAVGLLVGITLTGCLYAYVAHIQGLTLSLPFIHEPWKTLSVVSGAFLFSGFAAVGLIGLSKPTPLQRLRQLQLLLNISIPIYLFMATLTLTEKTPAEESPVCPACPPCLGRPSPEHPGPNASWAWVAGGVICMCVLMALMAGNLEIQSRIEAAKKSASGISNVRAEKAMRLESDREKKE